MIEVRGPSFDRINVMPLLATRLRLPEIPSFYDPFYPTTQTKRVMFFPCMVMCVSVTCTLDDAKAKRLDEFL